MSNSSKNGILSGKKGLIMGVANNRSIAWGVAKSMHDAGADLILSYQGEALLKRIQPLAKELSNIKGIVECDVSSDDSITEMTKEISKIFDGELDFVVHSIAFADRQSLRGRFCDTTRASFALALDISCYSFIAISNATKSLMPKKGGSIIGMSYLGSEKVIPNYNVMGVAKAALESSTKYLAADLGSDNIRVNTISPGPIKTLAASGIGNFSDVLDFQQNNSPLKRNISQEEVGNIATFLASEMSSGITGENIYADCGYNVVGIPGSILK